MSQHKEPKTVSLLELFDLFATDVEAEEWFVKSRWPNGLRCAYCDGERVHQGGTHPVMPFYCSDCAKFFSVKTNSVMHSSKLGYRKWAIAIYLFMVKPKGVSAIQLKKELGVTYNTAWHLGHRIRKAMENDPESLFVGPVEVDEAFIGGRARNQTRDRKRRLQKTAVIGMRDRPTNKIKAEPMEERLGFLMRQFVYDHTKRDAEVYTDEARGYRNLLRAHATVNHSAGEYGLTNGIESFWALFKRAYKGTYHKMSPKHLHRYTTELQERHNRRPLGTLERMESVVVDGAGKRLRLVDLFCGENERTAKSAYVERHPVPVENPVQVKIGPIDVEEIKRRARELHSR